MELTFLSVMCCEFSPRASLMAALLKLGSPTMPRYSWSSLPSSRRFWRSLVAYNSSNNRFEGLKTVFLLHQCWIKDSSSDSGNGVYLANGGQNVGFVVVVPVGADTKVHLLGAGVLVEGQRNTQDGVLRTLGHVRPY